MVKRNRWGKRAWQLIMALEIFLPLGGAGGGWCSRGAGRAGVVVQSRRWGRRASALAHLVVHPGSSGSQQAEGGGSAGGGGPSAGSTWACRRGAGAPSPSRAKIPLAARGGDAAAHSGGGKATGRPEAALGRWGAGGIGGSGRRKLADARRWISPTPTPRRRWISPTPTPRRRWISPSPSWDCTSAGEVFSGPTVAENEVG